MNPKVILALISLSFIMFSSNALGQIADPYDNPILNEDLRDREIKDKNAFKQFSNEHFPGVLEFFSQYTQGDGIDLFEAAAEEIVDVFEEYRDMVEDERADEIEEYLRYKKGDLRSWQLGKEIMLLRQAQLNGTQDDAQQAIEKKEAELYGILEQQYALKLEYQKREFEEMRRELAALEQALKKRAMLKEQIIRRRLLELTGDDDVIDWD